MDNGRADLHGWGRNLRPWHQRSKVGALREAEASLLRKTKAETLKRRRATDPTRDAPFDVTSDGDFASLRNDLSEDEIKEQADRQKTR